jgi:AcrR family transcriptional regulator
MTESGLRERKKLRTRDALIDSAFILFRRKGFEATTIDEIAEAVDISPRTFFRYFASKEEVALSLIDEQLAALLDHFEHRPPEESVLDALRNAGMAVLRACEEGEEGFDPLRFESVQVLMASSPALLASAMEQGAGRLTAMAKLIGTRMGVDYQADPRPYLVASIAMCSIQTAITAWRESEPDTKPSALVDRAFRLLAAGIDYPSALG